MRAMASSLGYGAAIRAFAPSMPPHTCPGRTAGGPRRVFFAAGASGKKMRQYWSARREATAIDSNSPEVLRRED
jgi:hypothetical protein